MIHVADVRRSGNFVDTVWDDSYIQSLTSSYTGGKCVAEAEKLKNEVKIMIDRTTEELEQLELIDNLQRIGLGRHFESCIEKLLDNIYKGDKCWEVNLHFTSLKFRLLRHHGYHVSEEVFGSFMDDGGNFKSSLGEDVQGLISLYDASHLSMEGESILDLAKDFSKKHLTQRMQQITEPHLAEQARHALQVPLHWRAERLEAKWFVQFYETRSDANPILLKLAKLDFNMAQATYQDELKRASRWYTETGLPEKLSFARHRLTECFLWSIGFIPELEQGYSREILAMVGQLITVIDDIYDVHGTFEELQLFTETIERWDINSLDRLPEYMQICFMVLFNSANELAHRILKEQGFNVISNLRRMWAELSRAYYLEASWFHHKYVPTTDEYLNASWVSISGPLLLFYFYICTKNPINNKDLAMLHQKQAITRWSSMVTRLTNDLGTSSYEMERGDVPKSVQCFMNETGCSEEEAREKVKRLIEVAWKRMNKELLMEKEKPLKNFLSTAMNFARMSVSFYKDGDGFGIPHFQTKDILASLIVQPIPMP